MEAMHRIEWWKKAPKINGSNELMKTNPWIKVNTMEEDEACGGIFQWNGELGDEGFLVEVRPTIKGFSKSFSRG